MSAPDDDLLARLNALKPSSITLKPAAPSIDVGISKPQTVEDKLAERLKTLRSGGVSSQSAEHTWDKNDDFDRTDIDPIKHWQAANGEDQTLEELLEELGPDDQWKLDPEDPNHIDSLLKEARSSLHGKQDTSLEAADADADAINERQNNHAGIAEGVAAANDAKIEDEQDEVEADDYVKQVLAELDYETRYGGQTTKDKEQANGDPSEANVDLPSIPANLPTSSSESAPPSYEDSELEARFSKLGLGGLSLPSTPTSRPTAKPKVTARLQSKSKLPKYTDEDIDSWCCICNEDGEVRCLGCDNDIYCQSCWQDGHGNGPGQERGHKAVQYSRRPPPAAA